MIQFRWNLLRFAYKLGMASIVKGHFINGMKQILAPILYWPFPEFSECLTIIDAIGPNPLKVLDIGSPKLFSLFLVLKRNHTVYATDLQDPEIFRRYKQHFDDWRLLREAPGEYIVEFQDARSLQYNDNTFDVVFSLEVLGHIPGNGDTVAMLEINRVLKKDGLAIIAPLFMWGEPLLSRLNLIKMDSTALEKDITMSYKRAMNITMVLKKNGVLNGPN